MYHEHLTIVSPVFPPGCQHQITVDILVAEEDFLNDDALKFCDLLHDEALLLLNNQISLRVKQVFAVHGIRLEAMLHYPLSLFISDLDLQVVLINHAAPADDSLYPSMLL